MLDGTNPYGPEYYRKRAQEVLKLAELSRFDDVREPRGARLQLLPESCRVPRRRYRPRIERMK